MMRRKLRRVTVKLDAVAIASLKDILLQIEDQQKKRTREGKDNTPIEQRQLPLLSPHDQEEEVES